MTAPAWTPGSRNEVRTLAMWQDDTLTHFVLRFRQVYAWDWKHRCNWPDVEPTVWYEHRTMLTCGYTHIQRVTSSEAARLAWSADA